MKNASRSAFVAGHALLSLLVRSVTGSPILQHAATVLHARQAAAAQTEAKLSSGEITGYVVVIAVLVVLSGITAGLTLGLMSLDETQLYVLSQSGSAKQKAHAAKIIPIRKNGHLLLVSLLLMNVVSNETLPIISEKVLGSGVISVVISTVMIVIFSEILPQAVCSTHGLAIGAAMAFPVQILIWLMFVVSWPVAKLLDLILGENHGMVYRRAELKELIDFHSKQAQHGGDLSIDAVTIMRGALDLQEKKVKNSMTPIDSVFMLHANTKLDRPTIQRIVESGHSRIPIYDLVDDEASVAEVAAGHYSEVAQRQKIIGCLLAKNLLLLDPDDEIPLSKVSINHIPSVQDDLPLFDILNIFQEGRSHLAVVFDSPITPMITSTTGRSGSRSSNDTIVEAPVQTRLWSDEEMSRLHPIGIITLEDVLEELIQEPIWDETDTTESRPRAGLAVPLQGTGETLILATNRGRPTSRTTRQVSETDRALKERSVSNSLPAEPVQSGQFEMVNVRKPPGTDPLASYHISRSNSAAPADAKLPDNVLDPFVDDQASLVVRSSPLGAIVRSSGTFTNKHLSHIKTVPRPRSTDLPARSTPGTSPESVGQGASKSRFKSRSTSSSSVPGSRRTQSTHNTSSGLDNSWLGERRPGQGSTTRGAHRSVEPAQTDLSDDSFELDDDEADQEVDESRGN